MRNFTVAGVVGLAFCLCGWFASAQNPAISNEAKEKVVTAHAKGTFEVKLLPLDLHDKSVAPPLSRMSIDKQFHGDLEGASIGEMLAASTDVKGSAGYVAIERVTGALQGRSGSFVLQHSATLNRGTPQMLISVVPDSGTGQLAGLAGTLNIKIENGQHFYDFEYTLSPAEK